VLDVVNVPVLDVVPVVEVVHVPVVEVDDTSAVSDFATAKATARTAIAFNILFGM